MPFLPGRAVELGITAEDLIVAEEEDIVSSPRRLPVVDSDGDVTKAMVSTRNEQSRAKYKEVPKGFQELFFHKRLPSRKQPSLVHGTALPRVDVHTAEIFKFR